jgi:hypothetical protein
MGSSLGWARGGVNRHGQRRFVDACAAVGQEAAARDGRLLTRWR